jgi:hypothetical protein
MSLTQSPPPQLPHLYDTFDEFYGAIAHGSAKNDPNNIFGTYYSCGVSVLSGLSVSSPEQMVNKVLKERAITDTKKIREAFVVFSDVAEGHGGNSLCRYIKDNKLGDIVEFGPRMNPNTGNMIKMWVWSPPHESLHPSNRFMPVHGKRLVTNGLGYPSYNDDPRFVDGRIREA